MTQFKLSISSSAARLLGAAALLLTLAACEPHDADVSRAFFDPHYEHQLHHEKVIPVGARLYYEGAPQDPVLRTNSANPRNYTSGFRANDRTYPENLAKDAHYPKPHEADAKHDEGEHKAAAGDEHAAGKGQASPPKPFFPGEEAKH